MRAQCVSTRWIGASFLVAGVFVAAPRTVDGGWRINLTIVSYRQIDPPDDRLGGEFYPRVWIDGRRFRSPGHREDTMRDMPNWVFVYNTNFDRPVPIRIGMWDHDLPDGDDHLDVNPRDGRRDLRIMFDPVAGLIWGDRDGFAGHDIPVIGRGESNRVQIVFRITGEYVGPPVLSARPDPQASPEELLPPVANNLCRPRPGRHSGDGDLERWAGGIYAPTCVVPIDITRADTRNAVRGGQLSISSAHSAFGPRRDDLVIGLLQFVDGRMVARHLLQVADWRPDRIVAHVHRAVQPGDYGLAILHALPQSAQSVAGVFELASETLPVSIR